MIVVDTNVLAYLLIPGDLSEKAEAVLRKDPEWATPILWRSEFRNVLLPYIRNGALDIDGAVAKVRAAGDILEPNEIDIASGRVLELAVSSGCTAYNCEFVCAAEQLRVPLVTADKKLLAAFASTAVSIDDFISL